MRRLAAAALASALVLPLLPTGPAHAAGGHEILVYLKDGALWRAGTDLTGAVKVADVGGSAYGLSAAAAANVVTYVLARTGSDTATDVVVQDLSGRVLRDIDVSHDGFPSAPHLSSDGKGLVYTLQPLDSGRSHAVYRSDLSSEGAAQGFDGFQDTLIVGSSGNSTYGISDEGNLFSQVVFATSGAPYRVYGLDAELLSVELAPDGKTFAAVEAAKAVHGRTVSLVTGQVGFTDGYVAATDVHTVVQDDPSAISGLAFSQDGSRLYFTDTVSSQQQTHVVPVAGGTPTRVSAATDDDPLVVSLTSMDSTPPAPVTAQPAVLAGTRATVRWGLPADSDLGRITLTRTATGTTPVTIDLPPTASSYADSGLVLGNDYTYTLTAVDSSGNASSAVAEHLVATSAALRVPSLTALVVTRTPFPVTFPASDHATIHVLDTFSGHGTFVPWGVDPHGTKTYGRDGGKRITQGHTYAFRLQVFDHYGNSSLPTTTRATVPFDDNYLSIVGGSYLRVNGAHLYGGSAFVLRPGTIAHLSARGTRLQLVGTRCPTCGVVEVVRIGKVVGYLNTYAPTRQDRVLLGTLAVTPETHTYELRPQPHGTQRDVVIDAFAYPL